MQNLWKILRVLCQKLQSQALVQRYCELNAITQAVMQTLYWNTTNDEYNESIASKFFLVQNCSFFSLGFTRTKGSNNNDDHLSKS